MGKGIVQAQQRAGMTVYHYWLYILFPMDWWNVHGLIHHIRLYHKIESKIQA
jgi:hypothetical protein